MFSQSYDFRGVSREDTEAYTESGISTDDAVVLTSNS